jgi:hypothetical protein
LPFVDSILSSATISFPLSSTAKGFRKPSLSTLSPIPSRLLLLPCQMRAATMAFSATTAAQKEARKASCL